MALLIIVVKLFWFKNNVDHIQENGICLVVELKVEKTA